MNPLELLDSSQRSDEFRRAISTAAILWALSSITVVLISMLGWNVEYEDALPFVILTSWLGAEIVARLPGRIPIAVCEKCERVQLLPRTPLRRLWPWKRCIVCGGQLRYSCPNKHLLSLFVNEEISPGETIWCSRCGQLCGVLSADEFYEHLHQLTSRKPQEVDGWRLAPLVWSIIRDTDLENKLKEPMLGIAREWLSRQQESSRRFLALEVDDEFPPLKPPEPAGPDELFKRGGSHASRAL